MSAGRNAFFKTIVFVEMCCENIVVSKRLVHSLFEYDNSDYSSF
jgi:hypothetical protein